MSPGSEQHRRKRRRAALRHTLLTKMPARLLGRRLKINRPGNHFCINRRIIDLADLPDELCGLKITHLSDPHVGELVTPAHLPAIIKAANDLKGDLIAVTGDFIDFSNDYLPPVIAAMSKLRAPLGVYFVLGNHDYLDNGEEVKRAFRAAGLHLLVNQIDRVNYEGRHISIGGIDWPHAASQLDPMVRSVSGKIKSGDLSILLAHHPHAFDIAHDCGIDLTLSGHTHGGQFLLSTKRGKKGSIGLANLGFRYTRGIYQRGKSCLFVSSGVGSWFPLRFRCPAEITLLELQNPY